jgi:hypothetical protein
MQYISIESLLVTLITIRVKRNQGEDLSLGRIASLSTSVPRGNEQGIYLPPKAKKFWDESAHLRGMLKELESLRADVMALPGAAEAAAAIKRGDSL